MLVLVLIEFNAGTGLSQTGSNASANQNNDTAKTFNVNTADGITIDGSNNVIIDPTFNIGTDEHGVHDGKINIDAGLGLAATGSNATANQKSDTNRVLSAKTADGITIDSNGNIIIDPNFNLDGNITPPGDGKITIKDFEGTELGSFTVNQDGPTDISLPAIDFPDSLHPKGFINVEDPAPTGPEHGDIYIQHKTDGTDATSDASFDPAIAPGTTVPEGSLVIFGVDDKWHFGGNVGNTQVQSDWAVTDASDVAFIKNKPDLQAEVDLYAGDGAINVNAGPGLSASGSNATANQKSGTTRTLQAKVADGIIINGSGEIIIDPSFNLDGNVTAPGNGQINVNGSDGITASGPNATANQGGNTTRTLKVDTTWLGSWIDTNKPAPNVGDGQITIKDADGNSVGAFTVNQASDQDITLPEAGDVKWDDIQNKPCVLECGISCTVEYTFLGNIDPEDYFNRPPIQQYSLNTPNDRDKSKSITGNSWQWYAYQITEEQQFVLFGKPDEEKFAWGNDLEYSDDYDYSATFELDDGTKVHVIQFYNAGPYSAFQTITAIDSDLCGGTSGIGDGKINIRTSKGVSIGSFTVNQDFDQDIFLDSFPEAPDDGNVYVRDGTNEQWVRGIPYNYSVLDELV